MGGLKDRRIFIGISKKSVSSPLACTIKNETFIERLVFYCFQGQEDENLNRQTAAGKAPVERFPQSGPSRLNEKAKDGRCDEGADAKSSCTRSFAQK